MLDAIADIEVQLGLNEAQLPAGVVRALADYRAKARKDPKQIPAFRSYVERVVRQSSSEVDMDPDTAATLFMENVACWRVELDVETHEMGRYPSDCEAWCAIHLQQQFQEVQIAMAAACDRATARTFENLGNAYRAMLEAYVRAV